jgi:hypothetical protein
MELEWSQNQVWQRRASRDASDFSESTDHREHVIRQSGA